MLFTQGRDFSGANTGTVAAATYEICGQICMDSPACAGVAWQGGWCYPKNEGQITPGGAETWGGVKCAFADKAVASSSVNRLTLSAESDSLSASASSTFPRLILTIASVAIGAAMSVL